MSVKSLCTGSSVVKQVPTNTTGSMMGNTPNYADSGSAIECNVQTMGASEALRFDARGERVLYTVFFSADPSLTKLHRLKVTKINEQTLTTPKFLRVLATEFEGRPSKMLLWYAHCEELTIRREE